jgi:phage protein U
MFATFGDIVFEVLTAPESLESMYQWSYAEHRVVEDVPRLQWVGDGLETITIGMMFHASFADPGLQVAALRLAASDHSARALVFGNGDHRGYFVILSMRVTSRHMASDGSAIMIVVQTTLKEWSLEGETGSGASVSLPFAPIGVVPAAAGTMTGPITYSLPSGITSTPEAPATAYSSPTLAAPGVSSILSDPQRTAGVASTLAANVATSAIVRRSV